MTKSEADGSTDDEQGEPNYTIAVNNAEYELNKEFRALIQRRAASEYSENDYFSCWWKHANPDDYSDEEWEENNHEAGDPILVIETRGTTVPWDQIDELEFEMEDISEQADDSEADYHEDEIDEGGGMKTIDPDSVGDEEEEKAEESPERTHFPMTPKRYEEIPSPDGDEHEKLPPAPIEMDDDPALVWWIPRHPDIEERWSAGEAITKSSSWVEWNIQARADEIAPRPDEDDKPNSHDRFESMLKYCDCEKVAEVSTNQNTPSNEDEPSGQVERKGKDQFENGKFGGDNFHV